jgi:KDO2-lipid IV(A) lauroyltransferase
VNRCLLLLLAWLARLQPDTAGRLGAWLGSLAFHLGVRRQVVGGNLSRCLGLHGPARYLVSLESYRSIGATMLQLWSYGKQGPASVVYEWADPTWARRLGATTGGYVLLTLHSGNWDVAGLACSQLFRGLTAYATPQHNPAFDQLINAQRLVLGMEVVLVRSGDRRGALQAVRGLRAGHSVGLLADQGPRPEVGHPGRFFGQPVWCHHGPVVLARRAQVPIVPIVALRVGWNRYRAFLGRPFDVGPLDDAQAVQACMDRIEAMIRLAPGQYFWHHRRFKRTIAGMPPMEVADREGRGIAVLTRAGSAVAGPL